ncbi:hypothetical protein LAWI1_G002305 [Lachnellula willkommii]|uniref:Uncharacterized protein n=1 Tax=Lachnellula willkommii TaxID=215461 RepID=A0A559MII5_9HELO|nr:hypothetical protein LAWI1_G002305 [Lachnellula willkommii]
MAPLLGAAMIAISRCEDYRRYYPRLRSPKCDEPFPSRETLFNEGFGKLKNDEETGRVATAREFDLDDDEEE